jgi:hypothetical protein
MIFSKFYLPIDRNIPKQFQKLAFFVHSGKGDIRKQGRPGLESGRDDLDTFFCKNANF